MSKVDPNPAPAADRTPTLRRAPDLAGWGVGGALVVFVSLRLLRLDRWALVATAQSLTTYVLLPVWVVLGWACATRRWPLVALSAVVASAHLAWVAPELLPSATIDDAARAAPRLTVFSANVYVNNPHPERIVAEVRRADPDIVLLQEYDAAAREAFEADGLLDRYPHRIENRRNDPNGALIASRLPFVSAELTEIDRATMPVAVVATAIGPVLFVSVHAHRPVTTAEHRGWVAQHEALADLVASRTTPVVLAGDFNATTAHRPFRTLLASGITDAHLARGDGLVGSWPNNRTVPPFVRIDHLLATDEMVPLALRNGEGSGSDHAPLVAELALVGRR